MAASVPELESRVASRTVERDMESEDWTKAVAINGLLATDESQFVEAAQQLVDRSIETQTSEGYFSYGSTDPIPSTILDPEEWPDYELGQWQCHGATIGQSVLEFYERTGDNDYLEAAHRQYDALCETVRTAEGGISYNSHIKELWVDSLYMIPPFLARYGGLTDTEAAVEEAVDHITIQAKYLQDEHTGLFRHIWREQPNTFPEDTFWSRGNGWAAAGIVDTLAILPEEHPDRDKLVGILLDLLEGIIELQDASGYWHNILDDPYSPLEASGTLMFSYVFEKARHLGFLKDGRYREAAKSGFDICTGIVDENGDVQRIAMPPGGPGVSLGVTSYGQGWFLLAANCLEETA